MKDGTESCKGYWLLPCNSNGFLNFRVSGNRFIVDMFLIRNVYSGIMLSGQLIFLFPSICIILGGTILEQFL